MLTVQGRVALYLNVARLDLGRRLPLWHGHAMLKLVDFLLFWRLIDEKFRHFLTRLFVDHENWDCLLVIVCDGRLFGNFLGDFLQLAHSHCPKNSFDTFLLLSIVFSIFSRHFDD